MEQGKEKNIELLKNVLLKIITDENNLHNLKLINLKCLMVYYFKIITL